MEKFEVHILGCGSALPTMRHWPSAQVINIREKLFMVDCGEGAQAQLRRSRQKFTRLSHIFISHLHGDHVFGLIGLLSTLALTGRTAPLHIYAHEELETLMKPHIDFFCNGMAFEVIFHALPKDSKCHLIYEDRTLEITTLPLKHRIPACGFLFREKPLLPHIRRDMIDYLKIPNYAILTIKQGAGWTTPDGDFYEHERLVIPADAPRAYAYCSDTKYRPKLAEALQGVDVLYHEATFGSECEALSFSTCHSTARQAALVAQAAQVGKLVIGHYSSRYDNEQCLLDEAKSVFENTYLANEGMVIKI